MIYTKKMYDKNYFFLPNFELPQITLAIDSMVIVQENFLTLILVKYFWNYWGYSHNF